MTGTIEVPRDLLSAALDLSTKARKELRALLAAPVVDRQPFGFWRVPIGCPLQGMFVAWTDESAGHIASASDVFDFRLLYDAPPELAELQATVARLTAEKERLNDGNAKHWKVVCDQREEIERLKGGQGEPVAWRYQSHAGGLWYLSSSEHNARTFQGNGEVGAVEPLYTSQPAPVAVALPERKHADDYAIRLGSGSGAAALAASEWNACLDKVKEMNQ